MGHLTRIANCIVHSTEKGPNSAFVQQLIKGNGLGLAASLLSDGRRNLRAEWKDS